MPKLNWNKFLDKHTSVTCIEFGFAEYAASQAALRKVRSKGARIVKTGKVLPTPNSVISKFAADKVTGDYTIKAEGPLQTLLFANSKEAKHFAAALNAKVRPTTPDRPCDSAYQVVLDVDAHKRLAAKYGLY